MRLSPLDDKNKLVNFLKKDYANNIYFFDYLDERIKPEPNTIILTAGKKNDISLALLVSKNHCCISAADSDQIEPIADQIPDIFSHNILGRSDLTQKLLDVTAKQNREVYPCHFCRLTMLPEIKDLRSQQATAI